MQMDQVLEVDQFCQSGNFTGGGFFMNHPFFGRSMKCGLGGAQDGRFLIIIGFNSNPDRFFKVSDGCFHGTVPESSFHALFCTFFC